MMNLKRSIFLAVSLLQLCGPSGYTQKVNKTEVIRILSSLKYEHDLSYKYSMEVRYPDDTKQELKGEVYMNSEKKIMFNDNKLLTILYTGDWYYRANHKAKEVQVIDVQKHMDATHKQGLEKDVFQNATGLFLDSVVMKLSVTKYYKLSGDTATFDLGFPEDCLISSIHVMYDNRRKLMLEYSMRTFRPEQGAMKKKGKGFSHYVRCTDFERGADPEPYLPETYFKVVNKNVTLKKNKSYKLNVKL